MVNGEPIDYERVYTVGGTGYLLTGHGDGHAAFGGEVLDMPYIEDAQALEQYLTEGLGGEVPGTYADRHGEGRITIIGSDTNASEQP